MEKKDYEKLNEYLNGIFKELEKNNSFLLRNLVYISILCDRYIKLYNQNEISNETKTNHISFNDVFLISRDIIKNIDSSYLEEYDKLIESGELDFSYDNEYNDSHYSHSNKFDLINLNRDFNYNDVRVLIHEFMHYTNRGVRIDDSNVLLTEFISIYFEQYSIDYLLNNGISKEEIDCNYRAKNIYAKSRRFLDYSPFLVAFEKLGNIDSNTCKLLNENFLKVSEEDFEKIINNALKNFDKVNDNYKKEAKCLNEKYDENVLYCKLANFFKFDYCYILATMLSIYSAYELEMDRIIKFNNDIINDNIDLNDTFSVFKSIGIKYDEPDFFDEIMDYIKVNLETNNKVKL